MKQNYNDPIRQQDKKYGKKFAVILIIAMVVGGLLGFGLYTLADSAVMPDLSFLVACVGQVVLLAAFLGELFYGLPQLKRLKALFAQSQDSEEQDESASKFANTLLTFVNLSTVVTFVGFGLAFNQFNNSLDTMFLLCEAAPFPVSLLLPILFALLPLVEMVATIGLETYFSKVIINTIKQYNPEKQGSVYQMNFNKVWLESCDEAEKAAIYKNGYRAFRAGHYACLGCWLFAALGSMYGFLDWVSVLMVGIIWLTLQIA